MFWNKSGFFPAEYRDATEGEVTGWLAERSEGRSGAVPPRQPHPTQIRLQYSCSFSCSGKKTTTAFIKIYVNVFSSQNQSSSKLKQVELVLNAGLAAGYDDISHMPWFIAG